MKNLETIKALFVMMEVSGISLDDLNAFSKNQNQESVNKLPLEILYEHDYRSFFLEVDKKPVAIICDNIGFAFEDASKKMKWQEANRYCKIYSVGGKKWQLPNKVAGHLDILYKNKEAINAVLTAFGKEPLKELWYWASEYDGNNAWGMYFYAGSVYAGSKTSNNYYVRPVLFL